MIDVIEKQSNQPNTIYELSNKDPKEICKHALCTYNTEKKCYILPVWGKDFGIYPHENKIVCLDNEKLVLDEFFIVFITHYLLNAQKTEIENKWISEKDILGGPIFFRGMHTLPTHYITDKFGNDFQDFKKKCQQLQGRSIDMADASYRFTIMPRIPVLVQFWEKDDDFEAECKMLFDKSISKHLDLEIIFGLSVVVCKNILR